MAAVGLSVGFMLGMEQPADVRAYCVPKGCESLIWMKKNCISTTLSGSICNLCSICANLGAKFAQVAPLCLPVTSSNSLLEQCYCTRGAETNAEEEEEQEEHCIQDGK